MQAWQILAQNYARFDTPLIPKDNTLKAISSLITHGDPLVVVLGSTPIFAELARRVWFIDISDEALRLVSDAPQRRIIQKNWLDAVDELVEADIIVGDGSINAVGSVEIAAQMLKLFAEHLKPGATLAQRVFIKHDLPEDIFTEQLTLAFTSEHYSEVRFLVYGAIAGSDGITPIAEVDNYISNIESHLHVNRNTSDAFKQKYFDWRGITPGAASKISERMFFPSRQQIDAMFKAAGLHATITSAGSFQLAQFTPIYVVRA